jgi:hypothetical protein
MILFDYIFYRTCKNYMTAKDLSPHTTGWVTVGLVATLILTNIFSVARLIWDFPLPKDFVQIVGLPVVAIIQFLSWARYKKYNYDYFEKRWGRAKNQQFWGVITAIFCFGVLVIPLSFAIWQYVFK